MLNKLAAIATELDEKGHKDLADKVDEVMTALAGKKGVNPFAKGKKGVNPFAKGKDKKGADAVFPADHAKVTDKKEHFPLGTEAQAKKALDQSAKLKEVPSWFKGTLKELVSAVTKAVKKAFPDLDTSDKAKKPSKG